MKTRFMLFCSMLMVIATAVVLRSVTARASTPCDPDYVTQTDKTIAVLPTGLDDTANLQCAFDEAVAAGPGVNVHLKPGIYKTGQIVVYGFRGQLTGEGAANTTITNLPNLYVTPVDFLNNPPSAINPWPSLFAFVDGDFLISDLAINIAGDEGLTTGWTVFGFDPPTTEFAHGIVIIGSEANVRIERILMEGELMGDSLYGYNMITGIYYESPLQPAPYPPISGAFQVYDSTFRQIGFATSVFNLKDASVVISHNTYEGAIDAFDSADLADSSIEFSHNQVDALLGVWLFSSFIDDSGSSILIKNNQFRGENGPTFENTFGTGMGCLMLGNNVQKVNNIGVYLGPGTSGCTVVSGSNKTSVLDLGTDNILVGVNNMRTGVGPTLVPFMKLGK